MNDNHIWVKSIMSVPTWCFEVQRGRGVDFEIWVVHVRSSIWCLTSMLWCDEGRLRWWSDDVMHQYDDLETLMRLMYDLLGMSRDVPLMTTQWRESRRWSKGMRLLYDLLGMSRDVPLMTTQRQESRRWSKGKVQWGRLANETIIVFCYEDDGMEHWLYLTMKLWRVQRDRIYSEISNVLV